MRKRAYRLNSHGLPKGVAVLPAPQRNGTALWRPFDPSAVLSQSQATQALVHAQLVLLIQHIWPQPNTIAIRFQES